MLGQVPSERFWLGLVFKCTGIDYAGPILIKQGAICRPTLVKAYASVFVSLFVKAVHLELVSDLTTETFIATLRQFPSTLWSDHGTNFTGANRELKQLFEFLKSQQSQQAISKFCSTQNIQWKYTPGHAPQLGGIWEAAVKSMKVHLRKIIGDTKLKYEELSMVITHRGMP